MLTYKPQSNNFNIDEAVAYANLVYQLDLLATLLDIKTRAITWKARVS